MANTLFPFNGVRQLEEEELLEATGSCPLCESTERYHGFWLQRAPDVALLRCRRCGGASVSRMPTRAALDALYANFYLAEQEAHVSFGNVDRFGKHLLAYCDALTQHSQLRILDYGGGDGSISVNLAEKLAGRGVARVEVVVDDYDPNLATPAKAGVTVCRAADLPEGTDARFDIVVASGVIEHVPDPVGITRGLLAQLKDGGRFYARTPHVIPFMQLSGSKAVEHFFPFPAHLHDLGQHAWEYCFEHTLADTQCTLVASRPSIVQTSFDQNWKVALASHVMKAPWYLLGRIYPLVGGWEVVAQKQASASR